MMAPPGRSAAPRFLTAASAVIVEASAVIVAACGGPAPETDGDAPGGVSGAASPTAADARYITHLLFAAADGTGFFGSFDQTAEQDALLRVYDVWASGGDGWRPLVRHRDTLPVARAAWRLLPAGGMSVRIGDAGQVVSLFFPPPASEGDSLWLRAGEEVAAWTGPTGQRESLGLAALERGAERVPGILFFRRAARALRIPPTAGAGRTFVLADSLGNGLLIHEGTLQQPAVAHTWLHGIEEAWGDVVLAAADSSGAPGWRFEIPGTDLLGDVRPTADSVDTGAPAFSVRAVLSIGAEEYRFSGLTSSLPFP